MQHIHCATDTYLKHLEQHGWKSVYLSKKDADNCDRSGAWVHALTKAVHRVWKEREPVVEGLENV